jgi:AcrR family transcriptional regulator
MGAQTSERILDAGESLFTKFGTRRVTIDDICRRAGLSKMTFYKYFPGKIDLAKAVLRRLADAQMTAYREFMAQNIPFEEKVRRTIQLKMNALRSLGNEWPMEILRNPASEIGWLLQEMTGQIAREIRVDYEKAQRDGDIRADVRMDFIFYFIDHLQAMLNDERLVRMYDSYEALISELVNFFFYGILPRKTT